MDFAMIVLISVCVFILGVLIIRASLEKKRVQVFVYAIIIAIIFCWLAWARADVTDSVTISVTVFCGVFDSEVFCGKGNIKNFNRAVRALEPRPPRGALCRAYLIPANIGASFLL